MNQKDKFGFCVTPYTVELCRKSCSDVESSFLSTVTMVTCK